MANEPKSYDWKRISIYDIPLESLNHLVPEGYEVYDIEYEEDRYTAGINIYYRLKGLS